MLVATWKRNIFKCNIKTNNKMKASPLWKVGKRKTNLDLFVIKTKAIVEILVNLMKQYNWNVYPSS